MPIRRVSSSSQRAVRAAEVPADQISDPGPQAAPTAAGLGKEGPQDSSAGRRGPGGLSDTPAPVRFPEGLAEQHVLGARAGLARPDTCFSKKMR